MNAQKIAVAGATGRVGSHIVDVLEADGHEVVAIARSRGVDVITGEGLDDALAGVDAVVDAATGPSPEEHAATAFFTTAAGNLQTAGERAGVGRIVAVSIVGADRFRGGYGRAQVAHEQATLDGPVAGRVLRATQFHEFVEQLMAWGARDDGIHVQEMRTQIVAARTVAEALAHLATGSDEGTDAPILEIAGPREERLVDLARLLATVRGDDASRIEETTDPADPDAALMASGGLLPGPGAVLAGPTFAEWLAGG